MAGKGVQIDLVAPRVELVEIGFPVPLQGAPQHSSEAAGVGVPHVDVVVRACTTPSTLSLAN